jgi:hypothetical protein
MKTVNLLICPGTVQLALHAMAMFGRERVTFCKDACCCIIVNGALASKVEKAERFFSERGSRVEVVK